MRVAADLNRYASQHMQPPEQIYSLINALAASLGVQHRKEVASAFEDARELARHNEWGIALENLCCNLYEYEVPLLREHYDRIEAMAAAWDLDNSYIEQLRELIQPERAA